MSHCEHCCPVRRRTAPPVASILRAIEPHVRAGEKFTDICWFIGLTEALTETNGNQQDAGKLLGASERQMTWHVRQAGLLDWARMLRAMSGGRR